MATYGREDDLVLALQAASDAMSESGRFAAIAQVQGDDAAAAKTIEVAELYVAWLRRLKSIRLVLVAVESETGQVVATPTQGGKPMSSMQDNQQLRYVIEAADARNFPVDASLQVSVSDPSVISATITEATAGTASGKDELVVVAIAPGSSLVTVFDPANATTIFGSDSVDVTTGPVAAIKLDSPTVEPQA